MFLGVLVRWVFIILLDFDGEASNGDEKREGHCWVR